MAASAVGVPSLLFYLACAPSCPEEVSPSVSVLEEAVWSLLGPGIPLLCVVPILIPVPL